MQNSGSYNDIGIAGPPDWPRIRKLMIISAIAACLVMIGDVLLGWGMHDASKPGMEGFLAAYLTVSDTRIFWSSFLGLIGIPLEGLCYFAIYRLIAPYSQKYAHLYRSGIFGYLIFAACGVHVPCLASVFFYKYMMAVSPDTAVSAAVKFGMYFLLPGMILFLVFFWLQQAAHVLAFIKGYTPYPKWCWIFCTAFGMGLTMLLKFLPETPLRNALTAGWISIGNLWMFIGLLLTMRKVEGK